MSAFLDFVSGNYLNFVGTMVIAYLLGSFNFAIIITKIFTKEDIRNSGSGNAGATNVLRSQGKKLALLTSLGDLGKAALSVYVGQLLFKMAHGGSSAMPTYAQIGGYLGGLFCIVGHLYPFYFKFKGGKGVMAALGLMLVLDWRVALICLSVFIIMTYVTKYVSIGSTAAAISLPIFTFAFKMFVDKYPTFDAVFCTIMTFLFACLLVFRHKENLKRLIAGTETKIGSSKKKERDGDGDEK